MMERGLPSDPMGWSAAPAGRCEVRGIVKRAASKDRRYRGTLSLSGAHFYPLTRGRSARPADVACRPPSPLLFRLILFRLIRLRANDGARAIAGFDGVVGGAGRALRGTGHRQTRGSERSAPH